MITNNGITLLGKYLVGQIPSFASHIAVGCGPNVLGSDESFGDYSAKTSLDFEVDRFPIISRTTNVIDGEEQIIFTAEVPSDVRHGITEVGVYPAESNNILGSIPSQTLFSFTTNEGWQSSFSSVVTDLEVESDIVDENTQDIDTTAVAFFLESDNAIFRSTDRLARREQPRFLNNAVVVRGDMTALTGGGVIDTSGDYILISQPNLPDIDTANDSLDSIKIAFSVIDKYLATPVGATSIQISVVFSTDAGETATYEHIGTLSTNTERYIYSSRKLKGSGGDSLDYTSAFAWRDVTSVKIFANADSSSDVYIALDGLRFENLSAIDNRYSLVGYTKLKSADTTAAEYPRPIEKAEGATTYIEFRFALDVL